MRKTYDRLVKILCLFIPFKKPRSRIRHFLMRQWDMPLSIWNSIRLHLRRTRPRTVLIVEPNPFHGETLPGYVKYFQELGYDVDMILTPRMRFESPFIRYPANAGPNIYYLEPRYTRSFLKSKSLKKYDRVFCTSSTILTMLNDFYGSYFDFLGFAPRARNGFIGIYHTTDFLDEFNQHKYADDMFTLVSINGTSMLNPHYFGDVKITGKSADVTRFFAVTNRSFAAEQLFDSVRALKQSGTGDFRVLVGGRSAVREPNDIPADLRENIEWIGFLPFDELWKKYEESDFILFGLVHDNPWYDKYKTSTVSGTLQVVLGFAKPSIIHPAFIKNYMLDDDTALVSTDLTAAMKRAIEMGQAEYEQIQDNIKQLSKQVYARSLENLRAKLVL